MTHDTRTLGDDAPSWPRALFVAAAALTLLPGVSPALALGAGAAFGLVLGNPFPASTSRVSRLLLQASVVGLGFGMSLGAVVRAGSAGIGYTVAAIAATLSLGLALGRWIGVKRDASLLITAGTSICGGSAIAAVGPAIGAGAESMSIALATVFVLNGVALYVFPPIGHLVGLTQDQFAVWAAVAIHDTSSVVGAAAEYGPRALAGATVLKLARALWIVPVTLAAASWVGARRPAGAAGEGAQPARRLRLPWFIGLFVLAAVVRTVLPPAAAPALDALAHAARVGLVLTLFLIGAGLTRGTLRSVGARPMLQGLLLWAAVASLSLWAILRWVPA